MARISSVEVHSPSLKEMRKDHHNQIVDEVQRRLSWELQQSDIMSHLIDDNGKAVLPLGELNARLMILTTAGSVTKATVLSAKLSYLLQNPAKLATVVEEVRNALKSELDISMDAVRYPKYLNAVINEGLRLCPPGPWMLP